MKTLPHGQLRDAWPQKASGLVFKLDGGRRCDSDDTIRVGQLTECDSGSHLRLTDAGGDHPHIRPRMPLLEIPRRAKLALEAEY